MKKYSKVLELNPAKVIAIKWSASEGYLVYLEGCTHAFSVKEESVIEAIRTDVYAGRHHGYDAQRYNFSFGDSRAAAPLPLPPSEALQIPGRLVDDQKHLFAPKKFPTSFGEDHHVPLGHSPNEFLSPNGFPGPGQFH